MAKKKSLPPNDQFWASVGSMVADLLWDSEKFHAYLQEMVQDNGYHDRIEQIADETFDRIGRGFMPKK